MPMNFFSKMKKNVEQGFDNLKNGAKQVAGKVEDAVVEAVIDPLKDNPYYIAAKNLHQATAAAIPSLKPNSKLKRHALEFTSKLNEVLQQYELAVAQNRTKDAINQATGTLMQTCFNLIEEYQHHLLEAPSILDRIKTFLNDVIKYLSLPFPPFEIKPEPSALAKQSTFAAKLEELNQLKEEPQESPRL